MCSAFQVYTLIQPMEEIVRANKWWLSAPHKWAQLNKQLKKPRDNDKKEKEVSSKKCLQQLINQRFFSSSHSEESSQEVEPAVPAIYLAAQ